MALSAVEEAQLRDLIAQQAALLSLAGVEPTILSKLGATKVTLSDLPTASAINDADLLLLRQGVTDKSVTGLTFKGLIPTVADASETVKGVVELATSEEVIAGTDTVRAITSAGLQSKVASETALGIVELATSAESISGTSDSVVLTPLKLRNALNANGGAPIYALRAWVNFDGTQAAASMIRSSGNVSSITDNGLGDYTINFSIAMPDANYSVSFLSSQTTGGLGFSGTGPSAPTASSVRVVSRNTAQGAVDASLAWFAAFR